MTLRRRAPAIAASLAALAVLALSACSSSPADREAAYLDAVKERWERVGTENDMSFSLADAGFDDTKLIATGYAACQGQTADDLDARYRFSASTANPGFYAMYIIPQALDELCP